MTSSIPAAVTLSTSPQLDQTRLPDGALLIQLSTAAAGRVEALPLVIAHDRPNIRLSTPAGGRVDVALQLLESGVGRRRSGALVPAELLSTGLLLREDGEEPPRRPLRGLALPDPWAQHCFARLEVPGKGLVRVTGHWLAEHVDGPLPDPRTWTLIHNGQPEPLFAEGCDDGVFDPDDMLLFWAEPSLPIAPELGPDTRVDPWCGREIFFLASDGLPGARLAQETGEIVETDPDVYHTPTNFPALVHIEEDSHFSRLTYVLDEPFPDHQFWTTGIYGGALRTVTFNAPGLNPFSILPVQMRVCLRGLSAPAEPEDPDVYQRLRLFVNNQGGAALEVGAAGDWRNQELRIAEFGAEAFPDHSAFLAGNNTLILAGVDEPPAGAYSSAMLNWIELRYQRAFQAIDGVLEFTADPALDGSIVNFEIGGFASPDIRVLKLGQSYLRSTIIRPQGQAWRLRFQDEFRAGTRYVAATEESIQAPSAAERVLPRGLASGDPGAGVLIIVADSLMRSGAAEVLAPLLERVRQQTGTALVISDRWVYDEFCHGRTQPHGIRDYVGRAWTTWAAPPRWLLLVGDGVLAPRHVVPGREPVLPLMYEQVYKWGAASSDDWYTRDASGVQLPILVSRWPAATIADLQNLVAKEESYRSSPAGPWRNSLLFTSGARAQDAGIFMRQTEDLIRLRIPERHFIRRINAGEEGGAFIGSRPELLRLMDQGQLLVNYAGHGGGAVWEDNGLFRSEDVALLNNAERLPFVTNATCFIASLDYQGALGRALLNTGSMGAIGVLGSTGLGFRDTGMELVAEFTELLCGNPGMSVADMLRESKQRLWLRHVLGREGSIEARQTHAVLTMNTILGLPWQRLHTPVPTTILLENPLVQAGDTLHVSGTTDMPNAQGRLEIYSSAGRPAQVGADYVDGVTQVALSADATGAWEAGIPLPDHLSGGGATGSLRAWLPSSTGDGVSGVTWFYRADSLSQTLIWRSRLLPDPPRPGQPLGVEVHMSGPNAPDSLAALVRAWPPGQDSLDLRLPMAPVPGDPQRHVSSQSTGPWPDSTVVRLGFAMYRGAGVDSTTWSWHLVVARRPLLEWTLAEGRDEQGRVLFVVKNKGDAASDSLDLRFLRSNGGTAGLARLAPVDAAAETRAALWLPASQLGDTLWLAADWDTHAGGPHPPPIAVVAAPMLLRGTQWQHVAAGFDLRLTPEAGNRVLALSDLPVLELWTRQPGLRSDGRAWRLQWLDGMDAGIVEGRLSTTGMDSLFRQRADLLVVHGSSGLALSGIRGERQLTGVDSLVATFRLEEGDGLLLGWIDDSAPPVARLEVEGQVFADGGYVPPGAVFSWQLEDPNGVDPRPASIAVQVAGRTLEAEELSLHVDPLTGRSTLRMQLDGDTPREELTSLGLSCGDAAGNRVTQELEFRVGERLILRYAGSYPNPFQRETRFVFSLTGVAESATIDIYTVAGRRIRRLELPGPLINYVEVLWDGRDRVGDVVANGVYFYRLQASGPEGGIDFTGKVARLK